MAMLLVTPTVGALPAELVRVVNPLKQCSAEDEFR